MLISFSNPKALYLTLPYVANLVRHSVVTTGTSGSSLFAGIAGAPAVFNETCSGDCYQTWVLGSPSNYDNAYFEVSYLRIFSASGQNTIVAASSARALYGAMSLWVLVLGIMMTLGTAF